MDWETVFGRRAPLCLEIGFGNGEFLEQEALRHPERDYVGLEISWGSAVRLMHRATKHGLKNVRFALGEAELLTGALFASNSLHECTINHPCPWPKERHYKRRLIQAPFLEVLADRLQPDAEVTIQTDHANYADWIEEALDAQSYLGSRFPTTRVATLGERDSTKYQRKAAAEGIPIHYFRFAKESAPVPPRHLPYLEGDAARPSQPDDDMSSLSLAGDYAFDDLFEDFHAHTCEATHEGAPVHIRLHGAWRHAGRDAWMIETLTREGKLDQDFALLVQREKSGRLQIKESQLGHPHPTWALKRAIWEAGELVRRKHPALSIYHHNLGDAAPEASPR